MTTVPAAANAAVALAHDDTARAWGSAQRLLLNLSGTVLAGAPALPARKYPWSRQRDRAR